jgi:hypothetical protein
MAGLTTLSDVPSVITAGDTLLFKLSLGEYSSSDWTLAFSFRFASGSQIDFSSTASGSAHLVNVAPTETASWVPGTYYGLGRVTSKTDATLVATVWQGELVVKPDVTTAAADFDTRSWSKKCLDAIEAVLSGRASKDILNTTIAGQSIGRLTPEQLFVLRDRFRAEYQAEQGALEAAQGKGQRSNIGIIFTAP